MFLLFLRRCHCVSLHPVDPSKAKLSREEIYFGYVGSIITLVRKKRRVCVFNKVIPLWELSFAIIRAVKIDAMRWDGTAADFVRKRRKRREKGASSWSPTRNLVLYETRDVMRNWIPIGRIEFPLEWVWTFDGFELHLGSSIHSPRLQTMRHQVEIGGSQKQLQKEFNNLNNAPLLVEIKNRTIFSSFDPFHPLHSLPIVNRYFILTGAVKKKKKKEISWSGHERCARGGKKYFLIHFHRLLFSTSTIFSHFQPKSSVVKDRILYYIYKKSWSRRQAKRTT